MSDISASIAQLWVYPIKSCAGVQLQEAVLTTTGLDLDRAWMVVNAAGEFVTQREQPRLALVVPQLKTEEVVLRAPGMLALHLRIDAVELPARAKVWGDEVSAFDMGDLAAQWFTDFLAVGAAAAPTVGQAQKYRLVRFDPEHQRVCSRKWTGDVTALNQFSDGFPLLVVGQASLDLLNDKLLALGEPLATVQRFRPNIVLHGLDAHDEDRLASFQITTNSGEWGFKPVKPCARCPIPNIDPITAISSPAVGDLLQTYRQDARLDGAITFGMNVIILDADNADGTVLRVGQVVAGDFDF